MNDIDGLTVLLTRAREDAEVWADGLAARGARAVVFPCIEGQPIRDEATTEKLAKALGEADWLVVTSVRGVHGVAELAGGPATGVSIAAVGKTTAAAAERRLGRVDLIAPDGTVRSLADSLADRLSDNGVTSIDNVSSIRIVSAGAEKPNRDLEEALAPLGIDVSHVAVYRTIVAPSEEPRADLAGMGVNAIFVASPSAVTGLLARARVPDSVPIITIGPSTTRAAREAGLRVDAEATQRNLEGMIAAIP